MSTETSIDRVASLKRSRGPRRRHLTGLIELMTNAVDNKEVEQVEELLAKIVDKELELFKVDKELEAVFEEDVIEDELKETMEFSDKIIAVKVRANRLLAVERAAAKQLTTASSVTGASGASKASVTAKLPKLQIAKFEGKFTDWNRFYEQFKASIDSNTSLSNIDKFSYLRSLLSAHVNITIQGLQLSSANYAVALDLLQDKYGKPSVLKTEHINAILQIKPVCKSDDGSDLRRLYEECQTHLRSLETLGVNIANLGILLCPVIMQSLPCLLVQEWNRRYQHSKDEDLQTMLSFVHDELEGFERAVRVTEKQNMDFVSDASRKVSGRTSAKKMNPGAKNQSHASASALLAKTGNLAKKSGLKARKCFFCGKENHLAYKCRIVVNPEERFAVLKTARRCFKCFSDAHFAGNCDKDVTCKNCQGKHNSLLCKRSVEQKTENVQNGNVPQAENSLQVKSSTGPKQEAVASTASVAAPEEENKGAVALQTIRIWIKNNGKRKAVVALLDGGSERTFICKHLVEELRMEVTEEKDIRIKSFGGVNRDSRCRIVKVPIEVGRQSLIVQALEVQEICQGVNFWSSSEVDKFLTNPKGMDWEEFANSGKPTKVDLLIGSDIYWQVVTGQMKRLGRSLMAIQTVFGWTIQGKIHEAGNILKSSATCHVMVQNEEIEQEVSHEVLMQNLWEIDKMGQNLEEEKMTLGDVEVLQEFEENISFQDGRYSVSVPWNENKEKLCTNYGVAVNRLKRLLLQLKKDENLFTRYCKGMEDYLQMGHVEPVEKPQQGNFLYYMPHQPVIKEDRITTKLRIVFDASSKPKNQLSLNDCQHAGPNLNPDIFDILLRFRQNKIGIISDIEKAFLQVKINEEERDSMRFLWIKENQLDESTPKFSTFRMTRVLFGMKASPFLLAATIRYHAKKYIKTHPDISKSIDHNTYVDDHISGAQTTEEGFKLSKDTREIMAQGGFSLKKWTSNDEELNKKWKNENFVKDEEVQVSPKVLGLVWDTKQDVLRFQKITKIKKLQEDVLTKRKMLQLTASIFDPLGLLGPVLLQAKIFLQEAWRLKIDWDEEIPEDLACNWKKWAQGLEDLQEIAVPRWTKMQTYKEAELHIFCDASSKGYGAVAYLKGFDTIEQKWKSQLIAAKSRVSPIKVISLPRLELLGCLIGALLGESIKKAWINASDLKSYYWSDSMVALKWIEESPSKWKIFVANRVKKIQELTQKEQWSHCSSQENYADILSRGCSLNQLMQNSSWWEGPTGKVKESWVEKREVSNIEELKQELKEIQVHLTTELIETVLDINEFSTWRRLIRVTAWIRRFTNNCRRSPEERKIGCIEAEEWIQAEDYWLKWNQQQNFAKEIQQLKKKEQVFKDSRLLLLSPFLDDKGMIRLGGRLENSLLPFKQKHPIILGTGKITQLIILHKHEKLMHGGVQEVMVKLREKYWILKARLEVRRVLRGCLRCRRWKAKPGAVEEAPLPQERVTRSKAFTVTGVDFFGPLWVKTENEEKKMYGCIFTCAVTRAVHLELTSSQETESFLLALRRFLARRGECRIIWSDNAQTFKQADRLLKALFNSVKSERVQDFAAQEGITWKFIAPKAAWWGGFYERMIGTVKQHLRKTLGQAKLKEDELRTIFTEVEMVVNSRPLTYVSEETSEIDYLSPGLFLLQQANVGLPSYKKSIPEFPKQAFIRRWKYQTRLVEGFWKRWSREYLLMLKTAHQKRKTKEAKALQEGDVVLIMQDKIPRGTWKLGRVQEVTKGRDGLIRSVLLRNAAGNIFRRAIQQVCPLEILTENPEEQLDDDQEQ